MGVTVASLGVNRCGREYGNDGGGAGGGLEVDEFRRGLGYVGSCLRRNDWWGGAGVTGWRGDDGGWK